MNDFVLDDEELEILAAFEAGELKSVPDIKKQLNQHQKMAAETFKQDKKVQVRLAQRDLLAIQKLAIAEGISYQALMASVLHKFAEGRLSDRQIQITN